MAIELTQIDATRNFRRRADKLGDWRVPEWPREAVGYLINPIDEVQRVASCLRNTLK